MIYMCQVCDTEQNCYCRRAADLHAKKCKQLKYFQSKNKHVNKIEKQVAVLKANILGKIRIGIPPT